MKKLFIILLLITHGIFTHAQTVKKIKMDELETYIKSSDHPLVISFWATWCAPCVREIPWIQKAVATHTDKGVELILVNLDFANSYPKKLEAFIAEKKFVATHYWLNETNTEYFCAKVDPKWKGGLPANLFINNKTGYRKFFQRQLTDRQAVQEIMLLVQ